MYMDVSLERFDISEKCLDESTLPNSVLTDDTNPISLQEECLTRIEEWFFASNESILYLDKSLWSMLVIREGELHTDANFWFFYDFDFFELFFTTFCEACTRSCTESIDKCLL